MKIRASRLDDAESLLVFWAAAAHGRSVSDDLAGVTGLLRHDPESVVDDGNPGAHELYRAAGYMPDSSWTRWVRPLT